MTTNSIALNSLMIQARKLFDGRTVSPDLWLLLIGSLALLVPTLWSLLGTNGLWRTDEYAHGIIIFVIAFWLLGMRWQEAGDTSQFKPAPMLAWGCTICAAALYVPGRALSIPYLEVGAIIVMLCAIVLFRGGTRLLSKLKFPLIFMIFMIPLPNSLVSPLSGWMKLMVSNITVDVLDLAGFPVAQNGVVISLGQYRLLVAEACAGMRTLFTLEALGILYLNLIRHHSALRNATLPLLIIPISFTANIIRVLVLSLVTYYFGDEAGQGFIHGFAGMVLFLSGLLIMIGTDSLLRRFSNKANET